MVVKIEVKNSREMQAALLALQTVGKDIKAQVRKYTRQMILPEWKKGLESRATSKLDSKVLVKSSSVQVRDTNVVLKSGAKGKLKDLTKAVEFGTDRDSWSEYQGKSPKGKPYKIKRHTRRQLAWHRQEGRVVYPTANDLIPRVAALWVQTIIKTFYENWDKR